MPGNMSSMSRPGTGAGSTLQRGQGMRGSIDDLALMVAGAPPAQGALLPQQQQSYQQQPGGVPPSYPGHPGYPQQLSQFQPQQQQFQPHQQQFQHQQSYADQSEETEIM